MYINLLAVAVIATSAPATTNAIYIEGDNYTDISAKEGALPKPALLLLNTDEEQTFNQNHANIASSDGDEMVVTTLIIPEDNKETGPSTGTGDETAVPPDDGEVSITTTGLSNEATTTTTQEPETIAAEDSPLVGLTWMAVKYYDEVTDALVDVLQSTSITLEFEDDNRLDGHSGCNNYFTEYSDLTTSTFIVAGPVGSTMMMCKDDAMAQEMAYLNIFAGTINWKILEDSASLELTDADTDKLIAQYTLFTPLIIGSEWMATKYYDKSKGLLVDVFPDTTITLAMETNERFDGNAGCNTYFGSYDDLTSSSFEINGPVGSTKMLCEGTNLMEQEYAYLQNFDDGREIDWVVLDSGSLELRDAGSSEVFAVYTDLEAAKDPLSTSGATAFGMTHIAALALLAVLALFEYSNVA